MSNVSKLFTLLVLFAAISVIAFGTITLLAKQPVPDQNETPELYQEYIESQNIQKPFLTGFSVLLVFIILAIIGVGVVMFLGSLRGGM